MSERNPTWIRGLKRAEVRGQREMFVGNREGQRRRELLTDKEPRV